MSTKSQSLLAITDELLEQMQSSRVTLRQVAADGSFPITQESVAPGVRPIKDDQSIDIRNQPVVKILLHERRVVVQEDCRGAIADTEFHNMLDTYDVSAQIVAPVYTGDRMVAMLSVHHAKAPRKWTTDEVSLVWQAVERIRAEISRVNEREGPMAEGDTSHVDAE